MSTPPFPVTSLPPGTARPPHPRPPDDHTAHLSGGAGYAMGHHSRADHPGTGSSQADAAVGQRAQRRHR